MNPEGIAPRPPEQESPVRPGVRTLDVSDPKEVTAYLEGIRRSMVAVDEAREVKGFPDLFETGSPR